MTDEKEELKRQLAKLTERIEGLNAPPDPEAVKKETRIKIQRPVKVEPQPKIHDEQPAPQPDQPIPQPEIPEDPMAKFLQQQSPQQEMPPQPQQPQQQMPQQPIPQQPQQPYMNLKGIKKMQQMGSTIDKTVCAQESMKWLNMGKIMALISFIGIFLMYMFQIADLAVVSDIMFFMILFTCAYFLMRFQKQIVYLKQTYGIRSPGINIKLPQRQNNQRPPQYPPQQYPPQQPQQPQQYPPQQGGQQW